MKMVCPKRPLNSDELFRWSGESKTLLTLSACFSGTSKGYDLVKYASKASYIQATTSGARIKNALFFSSKHSSLIFHDSTSGARANTLDFSRQNTAVRFFVIRLPVRAHLNSIFLVKTQQFWFAMIRLPARAQLCSIFLVKTQHFDFS